jgi:hypothetical protein
MSSASGPAESAAHAVFGVTGSRRDGDHVTIKGAQARETAVVRLAECHPTTADLWGAMSDGAGDEMGMWVSFAATLSNA